MGDGLWQLAVDGVLVRLVDSETQVGAPGAGRVCGAVLCGEKSLEQCSLPCRGSDLCTGRRPSSLPLGDTHTRLTRPALLRTAPLRCCTAVPPQAHEEVLRLLLAAAPRLPALELSNYLTRTLNNSKSVGRLGDGRLLVLKLLL